MQTETSPPSSGGLAPRIIVAEDDPELRFAIADALRDERFRVTEVSDGMQLIAEFGHFRDSDPSFRVDLVVTDVIMPRCNGLTALGAIRRICPGIPAIVITGAEPLDSAEREGKALGATAVLKKPVRLADLLSIVHKLTARSSATRTA